MKLTVVIYSAPSFQSAWSAYQFTRTALEAGHEIYRLFFYGDGVLNNSALSVVPQGEFDLIRAWQTLIAEHELDAISCVSSALKRGIIDTQEAARYERAGVSLAAGMTLSGLGQLVDATLASDRVVSFGA